MNIKTIDLFSGSGGLSFGLKMAGYDIILGIDNWNDSLETFKSNHPEAQAELADLSLVEPETISKKFGIKPGKLDLIVGGPPCQGFSISGKRDVQDPRNGLYKNFVNFVRYFKPKAFIMENVPNLTALAGGLIKDKILNDFEKIGYAVEYKVLKASDFGVPQDRRRVVFVGFNNGKKFVFPEPASKDKKVTSIEALEDLPEKSLGNGASYPSKPGSEFQKWARANSKGVFNHETTSHTDKTVQIISMVPDGGNHKDLPTHLQGIRNVHIAWTRINSKKPSMTIDTGHRHHFHYKYNRVPTVRESARLQSFPDSFIFYGSKTSQYKQVGNAVPPLLAKAIGIQLKKYL